MLTFRQHPHPHHHDGHAFERLEARITLVAGGVGILIGLAMAVGLFVAQGHVTW